MSHETQNNLRIHYVSAAKNRQRQKFHKTLLLWAWLFAIAATLAAAIASAL